MKKQYVGPFLSVEPIVSSDVLTLSQNGHYDLSTDGSDPDMEWIFR